MRIPVSILILLGIIFSAGCQGVSIDNRESSEKPPLSTIQPGAPTREIPTPDRFNQSPTGLPERIPPTGMVSPMTGEVPDELLDMIMADLVERTGVAINRILVIQAQATIWNDGSLGCPQPGVFYTQALVNGFWVILEADGKKYDYRASESGYFFICENEFPPVSPPGTPDS
jgi:hypothetical protein